MNTVKHRYSAEIQRTRGLLELAAALYDTSLSFQTTRAAEQAIQTESRVGYSRLSRSRLRVKKGFLSHLRRMDFGSSRRSAGANFRSPGSILRSPQPWPLGAKDYSPGGSRSGPSRSFLRTTSWVLPSTSLPESPRWPRSKERIPLRLSTGTVSRAWVKYSPTMFTVAAVMKAAGFSFANLRQWGGKIQSVTRPSHPDRRAALEKGTINAVFDEGIKSWGQTAIDAGFRYLPVEGEILKKLTAIGYRQSFLPKSRFPALPADVPTVDFSGWPR